MTKKDQESFLVIRHIYIWSTTNQIIPFRRNQTRFVIIQHCNLEQFVSTFAFNGKNEILQCNTDVAKEKCYRPVSETCAGMWPQLLNRRKDIYALQQLNSHTGSRNFLRNLLRILFLFIVVRITTFSKPWVFLLKIKMTKECDGQRRHFLLNSVVSWVSSKNKHRLQ